MFHPGSTFRRPLDRDIVSEADANEPCLIVRYGSAADWLEYAETYDRIIEETGTVEQLRGLIDLLASRCTAVENLRDLHTGEPINATAEPGRIGGGAELADAIARSMTPETIRQHAEALPIAASLSELQAKKSARQSPSSTEASADAAATETA